VPLQRLILCLRLQLKGSRRKEKMAADLQSWAPQAAAAAAAAVASHNRTTQSLVSLMASGSFSKVVAIREDVLEAIDTLEEMRKYGPALGLLSDLGIAHRSVGDVETAVDLYGRGVELARRIGDKKSELQMLINIVFACGVEAKFANLIKQVCRV